MEHLALFVQPVAFYAKNLGVSVERFEMRSDFAQVVTVRRDVETVASQLLEFVLEGRMPLQQFVMPGRESRRGRA